jgi:hypothetical protein
LMVIPEIRSNVESSQQHSQERKQKENTAN